MDYECHVIVTPPFTQEVVCKIAKDNGFWGAILQHDEGNEEKVGEYILTCRHKLYREMESKMASLIGDLIDAKFKVKRYKIEHVVLDSNVEDSIGIMEYQGERTTPIKDSSPITCNEEWEAYLQQLKKR